MNVNDPNTKYRRLLREHAPEHDTRAEPEAIVFFNHHEFIAPGDALVVNHFPNNHAALNSATRETTRIVRIPRAYHTIRLGDIIPQFSTFPLGQEPAAIVAADQPPQFLIRGQFDGNYFGTTSITPLVPALLGFDELRDIVGHVNEHLMAAYDPYCVWNCLDNVLDFVTGTLYSKVVNKLIVATHCKRRLADLEEYILTLNVKYAAKQIRFISPRRSALLLLDVEISQPKTGPRGQRQLSEQDLKEALQGPDVRDDAITDQ